MFKKNLFPLSLLVAFAFIPESRASIKSVLLTDGVPVDMLTTEQLRQTFVTQNAKQIKQAFSISAGALSPEEFKSAVDSIFLGESPSRAVLEASSKKDDDSSDSDN